MYFDQFRCEGCGEICQIDGDYPKFFCWCDNCHDYAKGFDDTDYAAQVMSNHMEAAELRMDEEKMKG